MRPMRERRLTPSWHLSPTYDTEKMKIKRQQSVLLLLQHFAKANEISLPLWDLNEASLGLLNLCHMLIYALRHR